MLKHSSLLLVLSTIADCSISEKHREALTQDAIAAATCAALALAFSLLLIFCKVCYKGRTRYFAEDSTVSTEVAEQADTEPPKYQLNMEVGSEELYPPPPYFLATDTDIVSLSLGRELSQISSSYPPPYCNSSAMVQGEECGCNNCDILTEIV